MRQLMAGLVIMALAVTGCAASATTGSGKAAGRRDQPRRHARGRDQRHGDRRPGLGGLTSSGSSGLAQWVVDGTFETEGGPAQPLPGWSPSATAPPGTPSTSLSARPGSSAWASSPGPTPPRGRPSTATRPARAPVTVTVRAGQLTRVSLVCKASS